MELEQHSDSKKFIDITLLEVSTDLAIAPEYKDIIQHINSELPAIRKDTENFYKAGSQFKNVTLDVTDMTPMGSLKHILAVLNKTKEAIEEAHIRLKRKQIELQRKTYEYDRAEEGFDKELLWIDIVELNTHINNIENGIKGALRKMSFFTTQYKSILAKMGKDSITEAEYEANESRHHVMTAMKQALIAARTRGGIIDEGNQIYLFEMGINGAVAQYEVSAYLQMEQEMLSKGQEPTHELTVQWLEACADKFGNASSEYAQRRGLVLLDDKSLININHELTDGEN